MDDLVFEPSDQPWSDENHDVMADVRAAMEKIRAINQRPEVRTGSEEAFRRYLAAMNIEVRPAAKGRQPVITELSGVPVRIDPNMPPNMIRINNVLLIEREDGQWSQLDMDALDYGPVGPASS
jgi:hypothetical protein